MSFFSELFSPSTHQLHREDIVREETDDSQVEQYEPTQFDIVNKKLSDLQSIELRKGKLDETQERERLKLEAELDALQ